MKLLKRIVLLASITLNIILSILLLNTLNLPTYNLGVLTQDIYVGNSEVLFKLPKGLSVRDASPRFIAAIGQFEPYRFSMSISSSSSELVDYDTDPKRGALYPASFNKVSNSNFDANCP